MSDINETVIRGIVNAMRERGRFKAWSREDLAAERAETRAVRAAVAAFAALNGWRLTPASYDLDRLGRGANTQDGFTSRDRRLLDHTLWFSSARRFVAAVGQPYKEAVDLSEWCGPLTGRGFVLHVPPDPLASIHYPGSTLFLVVTLPDVTVRWLPEQDGRLAHLWKVEEDAA